MKFLLDQDVYMSTARFLQDSGHDVIRVAQLGLARAADEELLHTAYAQQRIMVTRDRDYGNLVFVKALGSGVIYLRMLPTTQNAVHRDLKEFYTAIPRNNYVRHLSSLNQKDIGLENCQDENQFIIFHF